MENQWVHTNSVFRMREVSQQLDALPRAVYKLQEDRYGFFLAEVDKEFSLPEKIYGLQRPFINRVKKSWQQTTGNMGILLNGTRGTGKTVTAEVIANESNLPVIIIAQQFEGNMIDFINELSDDCVIFFDEYDKIFEKHSSTLLTVMDGVLKRDTRIMFLLTTNDAYLNDNMYQRPSRIRYINTFGNLDPNVVIEVIDDCLTAVQYREETIRFISELSIITIDLVKSIIQEVNIHQESPYAFRDVFNITGNEKTYEVTEVDENDKETVIFQRATIDDYMSIPFTFGDVGSSLYINGNYVGVIKDIINPTTIEIAKKDNSVEDGDDNKIARQKLSFKVKARKHYSFIERGL